MQTSNTGTNLSETTVPKKRVLSQHDKFRAAMTKFQKIASLASEASSRVFPQRLAVLERTISFWGNDQEVYVQPVGDEEHLDDPDEVLFH